MKEYVSSNEESNSAVRQQWKCGKGEVKEEIQKVTWIEAATGGAL